MLEAVDRLLHDQAAKEKVTEFQRELMKWDGPGNAAKFLYETFGEKIQAGHRYVPEAEH